MNVYRIYRYQTNALQHLDDGRGPRAGEYVVQVQSDTGHWRNVAGPFADRRMAEAGMERLEVAEETA